MASVIEKRRADGRTYYYLVESARVDGKPRIVSQQYLGSAAEVAAKLAGAQAGTPTRSQHKRFGDLAAVWSVLERLGVAEVIDAVVPRRADAGATVGTYLTLACANRVVDSAVIRRVASTLRPGPASTAAGSETSAYVEVPSISVPLLMDPSPPVSAITATPAIASRAPISPATAPNTMRRTFLATRTARPTAWRTGRPGAPYRVDSSPEDLPGGSAPFVVTLSGQA